MPRAAFCVGENETHSPEKHAGHVGVRVDAGHMFEGRDSLTDGSDKD